MRTLALGVLLVGADGLALAADADGLMREGIEFRRKGDEAAALKRFREAYELTKAPRALAQIALAEQALGTWSAAERHMQEALQAKNDPWIRKNRAVLEKSLATIGAHVGSLDVTGAPEGAEVRVDGEVVGVLPSEVRVTTGTVVLEVRAPGYLAVTRTTTITSGELTREQFNLQRASSSTIAPPPAGNAASGTSATGGSTAASPGSTAAAAISTSTSSSPEQPPPASGGWRRPAIWATGIGGALALGLGVTETFVWQGKVNSFNDMSACDRNVPDRGGSACGALYDDGQRAKLLAVVGYGVAGALAATSVVLYLTRPEPSATRTIACAPAGRGVGLSCALLF